MGRIILEHDEQGCFTLWLDNPERRNALDDSMLADMATTLERLAKDACCRLLVLRGRGSHFCAGRDVGRASRGESASAAETRLALEPLRRLAELVYYFPRPTIAAAQGYTLGAGSALVTWCDFALAAESAVFGYPEVAIGIPPTLTAVTLARRVPIQAAVDLLFTARRFNAAEAKELSLVTRVVPDERLDAEIVTLTADLRRNSPDAIFLCKQLLRSTEGVDFRTALGQAIATSAAAVATPDAVEGFAAFREKRAPDWPSNRKDERVAG